MPVDLLRPVVGPLGKVVFDQPPAHQLREQVAQRGAQRGTEADEREGDREAVQEAAQYREEQRAGNGKRLQTA